MVTAILDTRIVACVAALVRRLPGLPLIGLRLPPPPSLHRGKVMHNRDLTILGRQRDGDGQNKLLQINGSKDSSWYIINRMNLIQF